MKKNQLNKNVPKAKINIKQDTPNIEKRSLLPRPSTQRPKTQFSKPAVTNCGTQQEIIIPYHLRNPSEPIHNQIKLFNLPINIKTEPVCTTSTTLDNELKTSALSQVIAGTVHPNARSELPAGDKSKSCQDLQFHKVSAERSNTFVLGSNTSRSLITILPNSFISKAGVNEYHKPGTIPSYLNRNKANSLQTHLNQRQKAFDDHKKAFYEMQKQLNEKYENLVLLQNKVKNCVAKEVVLDKMELVSKGVKISGNGDTLEKDPEQYQRFEYEFLERVYGNLLRFESDLQKMNDTNREACQTILDIQFTENIKYVNSAALATFQNNSNSLLQKLTENIAEMKLEQEMALINCQTDLLLVKVKGGVIKTDHNFACNNGSIIAHEILQLSCIKEEPTTKLVELEKQNQILKILHTETEKNLDMSQKEVILLREQLSEFIDLSDKYKRLEIQHESNELKTTAMAVQIRDASLIVNRLTKDLDNINEKLALSTQQCQILTEHVVDLNKTNKELNAIIESNRNNPVVLNTHKDLEKNTEEISVPLSSEIEKLRCIIIQLKEEILELVQKHLGIINSTEHHQVVKSLELNLVKYDRRLQQSYVEIRKLKDLLRQKQQNENFEY